MDWRSGGVDRLRSGDPSDMALIVRALKLGEEKRVAKRKEIK